jgi:hypothetical protein
MEKETLIKILDFLLEEENMDKPFRWKWLNNEPIEQDDLIVMGSLDLSRSKIESLPKGLDVRGDLILNFCPNLETLPEYLKVGKSLNLMKTNVSSLPRGLEVGGDLILWHTPIAIAKKDTRKEIIEKEIIEMIKPGFIKGNIYLK